MPAVATLQNTRMRQTDELSRLEESLDHIRQSPADHGTVELIARRPEVDARSARPWPCSTSMKAS